MKKIVLGAFALVASVGVAHATPATETSPTGGALPAGVTKVGGLVVDMKGANGARVVSQLAASQMYRGFSTFSENPVPGVATGNPLTIGTQTGFTAGTIAALGGGLQSVSFRLTLFDGDTAPGNFDFNDNTFSVNGALIGNWSSVATERTSADGITTISSGTGFGDSILSTGFFSSTDAGVLASIFSSLSMTNQLVFTLFDQDPGDNFYDFTQGVDGGLINVGTGPVITPPPPPMGGIPEPTTWAMMIIGFGAVGSAMRRTRRASAKVRYA